jgi:hypothetical protein|tara:strand:+ start:99 stop:338 length:240 start_codon:yes stop_codon:yes gene_type:complete
MKIDKGIPVASARSTLSEKRKALKKIKFLFVYDMEIGDSFEVETRKEATLVQSYINRMTTMDLVQRSMPNGKIRVWRIK